MDTNNSDFLPLLAISREKAERNLVEARNYISIDLVNIRTVINLYHPLELAKMSVWEERRVTRLGKNDLQTLSARLMPFIVQSVLMSREYVPHGINRDVKKKDWQRLISLSQDLTRKLVRYVDNLAAWHYLSGTVSREDIMDYRESLFVQYFPSEKDSSRLELERHFAEASLVFDNDRMKEVFSVDADTMIGEMYKLASNGLTMIDDLSGESTAFKNRVECMVAQIMAEEPGITESDALDRVYRNHEIMSEKLSIEGRRDDYDLFRPDFSCSLPVSVYEKMSRDPGSVDLDEWLFDKGLWPVTVYPFIKMTGMYFSFVSKYIFAISERLSENFLGLKNRVETSATTALSAVFEPTDIDWIYSFDDRRIDTVILPVLEDVNPVTEPEYWQKQMKRKSEEYLSKPEYGHIMLIVDADDCSDEVENLGNDRFWTTASHLVKLYSNPEMRNDFYRSLFGDDVLIDQDEEVGAIFDADCIVPEEDDDPVEDELCFNDLDVDEYDDRKGESRDESLPEIDPLSVSFRPDYDAEEKDRFKTVYSENEEIIEKELGEKVPVSDYHGVLDEDIYSFDEDEDAEESEEEDDLTFTVADEEDSIEDDEKAGPEDEDEDTDQLDFMDLLDDYESEEEEEEEDDLEIEPEHFETPRWRDDEETPTISNEEKSVSYADDIEEKNGEDVEESSSFPGKMTEEGLSDLDGLHGKSGSEDSPSIPFPEGKAEEEGLSELNELDESEDNEVSSFTPLAEEKTEEEGLSDLDEMEEEDDTDLPGETDGNLYDDEVIAMLSARLGRDATIEDQRELQELLDANAREMAANLTREDIEEALDILTADDAEARIFEMREIEAEENEDFRNERPEYEMTDEALESLYCDDVLRLLADHVGHEPGIEDIRWLYEEMDPALRSEDLNGEDYNEIALAVLNILSEEDEYDDEKDGGSENAEEAVDEDDEEDEEESYEMTDEALECLYSDEVVSLLSSVIGHEADIRDIRWLYEQVDPAVRNEDLSGEDWNELALATLRILAETEEERKSGGISEEDDEEEEISLEDEDDEEYDEDEWEMTDEALEDLYDEDVLRLLASHVGHEPTIEDKRWLYEQMDPSLRREDLSGDDYNEMAKTVLTIVDDLEEDESVHETDEITGWELPEEGELSDDEIDALFDDETVALLSKRLGRPATRDDKRDLNDALDMLAHEIAKDVSPRDLADALAVLDETEEADDEALGEEEEAELTDEEIEELFDDETVALLSEKLGRPATRDDKRDLNDALDMVANAIARNISPKDLAEALAVIDETEEIDEESHVEAEERVDGRREDWKPFAYDDDHTAGNEEKEDEEDSLEEGDPGYFLFDDVSLDEEEEEETEAREEKDDDSTTFAFIDEDEDEEEDEESVSDEDENAPSYFLNGDRLEKEVKEEEKEDLPLCDEEEEEESGEEDEELIPEDFYTLTDEEENRDEEPVTEAEDEQPDLFGEETAPEEKNEEKVESTSVSEEVHPLEEEFSAPDPEAKESDQIVLEYADETEEEKSGQEEDGTEAEAETEEEEAVLSEEEPEVEVEPVEPEAVAHEPASSVEEAHDEEPAAEEPADEEEKPVEEKAEEKKPMSSGDGKMTSELARSLFFDVPGISPELTPSPKSEPEDETEPVEDKKEEAPSAPAPKNPEGIVLEYEDEEEPVEEEEAVSEEVPLEEEEEEKVFVVPSDSETASAEEPREKVESEQILSTETSDTDEENLDMGDDKTITLDLENPKYSEIVREIAQKLGKNAGAFADFLENEERVVLDHFNTVIRQSWERQLSDGKDKMFSVFNYDLSILLSKSMVHDDLRLEELLNNAGAVMYSKRKESWNALMVFINRDYTVESAELRVIRKEDFSPANWKIVSNIGQELINRRGK